MEASVVEKGNSKGIRLAKSLLERYNIKDTVELVLEENQIIIKPIVKPRHNWGKLLNK
jgi:antitoxin MazE